MFSKLFRVKCRFIDSRGETGKVSFETKYLFDLRKDRFIKMLEREIIEGAYREHGVVIDRITDLDIQRIG